MSLLVIPTDDASTADIVAFFKSYDRHGNWPDHFNETQAPDYFEVVERPSPDHEWYDPEGDCWLTDAECRSQLLPLLAETRKVHA